MCTVIFYLLLDQGLKLWFRQYYIFFYIIIKTFDYYMEDLKPAISQNRLFIIAFRHIIWYTNMISL